MKKRVFIFLGPPGSGKGTQAELLEKNFKIKSFSGGELLRRAIEQKTSLGKLAAPYLSKGLLVPPEIMSDLLLKKVSATRQDVILDGYPRTLVQAKLLDQFLQKQKTHNVVVEFSLAPRVVLDRISGRLTCACGEIFHTKFRPPKKKGICDACGQKLVPRNDSRPAIVRKRLAIYNLETDPIRRFFKKYKHYMYKRINAKPSIEKVHQVVVNFIKTIK